MRIHFTKMNGAGNDFVMIDNRDGRVRPTGQLIRSLCERKRGIGADGVILVETAKDADFRMRYYNSDGGEAEMCGNGARCVAYFASRLGLGKEGEGDTIVRFVASPGAMEAVVRRNRVAVSMTEASSCEMDVRLEFDDGSETVHVVDTGVPHAVAIETKWHGLDDNHVLTRGKRIRSHGRFSPAGVNADFVSVREDGAVTIRTFERGVEAETLACGTGAVAAAVVLSRIGMVESPVRLVTHGGETLHVSFNETPTGATDIVLEGPVEVNFEGFIETPSKE
jgi:diaminopimelate epimerase